MELTKENLQTIKETFKVKQYKHPKPQRPCRVKFMGEFITTGSNKTIWRKIGDAKSAITLHLSSKRGMFRDFLPHMQSMYGTVYVEDKTVRELIQYLEQEKIIEYIEVSAEQY